MAVIFGSELPSKQQIVAAPLPKAEKRNHMPFILMVHPERYIWDPKEEDWVVELGRLTISGGVGGVGLDQNGREVIGMAVAARAQQGWLILPDGDGRLADPAFGTPNGKYLARHPAQPHGYATSFAWEGYERVRNSIEWCEDRPRRVQFQRALESSGIVPAIGAKLMELDVRDATTRVRRLGDKQARNPEHPSIRIRSEEAGHQLKAMRAAQAKRLGKDIIGEMLLTKKGK